MLGIPCCNNETKCIHQYLRINRSRWRYVSKPLNFSETVSHFLFFFFGAPCIFLRFDDLKWLGKPGEEYPPPHSFQIRKIYFVCLPFADNGWRARVYIFPFGN